MFPWNKDVLQRIEKLEATVTQLYSRLYALGAKVELEPTGLTDWQPLTNRSNSAYQWALLQSTIFGRAFDAAQKATLAQKVNLILDKLKLVVKHHPQVPQKFVLEENKPIKFTRRKASAKDFKS